MRLELIPLSMFAISILFLVTAIKLKIFIHQDGAELFHLSDRN